MDQSEMLDAAEAALSVIFEDAYEAPERSTEPAEASEAGDTPELTIDAQGRAHGEDGKFVATGEEEGAIGEAEAQTATESGEGPIPSGDAPEETPEAEVEDDVFELDPDHPFFAKYGGDLDKAMQALEEGQSLVGRQSQELSELRELREKMDEFQQQISQQQQSQRVDWDSAIEEDAEQAAFMAVEYRDPLALEKAVEAWGQEDPFKAMMFMSRLQQAAIEEAQHQSAPEQSLEEEVTALKSKYPDLLEKLPEIQKLAAERPALAQALQSGSPQDRGQILEDLYFLAKSRTTESDTSTAARKIILKAKAETDAAKADAAVVSATKSSAATGPPKDPNKNLSEVLSEVFGEDVPVV